MDEVSRHGPLCEPCREKRSAWLDYRLPPVLGIAHGSGAPRDASAAGISNLREARSQEWKSTIRFNMDLIARTCRESGHADGKPVARVVQLDLLAAIKKEQRA